MKLRVLSVSIMFTLLASCGGEGVKDGEGYSVAGDLIIPDWVTTTPKNEDSYDAVVTVPNKKGSEFALKEAAYKVNSQLHYDLNKRYDGYIAKKLEAYSGLEKRVRSKVIADLPAMEALDVVKIAEFKNPITEQVSVWVQLKHSTIINGLKPARIKLDKHLRNYVHVNDKGSDLTTVLSILPALPSMELKNKLAVYIYYFTKKPVKGLKNDRLAELLEVELSNSFADLVVSLRAITDDSREFERNLSREVINSGLKVSSYKSDLIIKFFIEPEIETERGLKKITLITDSEMIDNDGKSFATIGGEYKGINADKDVATTRALSAFADDIVTVISASIIHLMQEVNKATPLPKVFEPEALNKKDVVKVTKLLEEELNQEQIEPSSVAQKMENEEKKQNEI